MDPKFHQHPVPLYSLEEVAALLGLPATNLLLWEMHFGDELNLARDPFGQPLFTSQHVSIIEEIDRMIRHERHSPIEVRRRLRQAHRNGSAKGTTAIDWSESILADREVVAVRDPAAETSAIDAPVEAEADEGTNRDESETPPSESILRNLSESLANLQEDVTYLLEENRALQELVGRLITYIEEMGSERAEAKAHIAATTESEGDSSREGESRPVRTIPEVSEERGKGEGPKTVRTWVPRALEE